LPFESLLVVCYLSSALSQLDQAVILPFAKVLRRDSVIIRFMLHPQQNDERSAERAEIKN
jgi:hypothetical protein